MTNEKIQNGRPAPRELQPTTRPDDTVQKPAAIVPSADRTKTSEGETSESAANVGAQHPLEERYKGDSSTVSGPVLSMDDADKIKGFQSGFTVQRQTQFAQEEYDKMSKESVEDARKAHENVKTLIDSACEGAKKAYPESSWVLIAFADPNNQSKFTVIAEQDAESPYRGLRKMLSTGETHGCQLRGNSDSGQAGLAATRALDDETPVAAEGGLIWPEIRHRDSVLSRNPLLGLSSNFVSAHLFKKFASKSVWETYRKNNRIRDEDHGKFRVGGIVIECSSHGNETRHIDDPGWLQGEQDGPAIEPNLEAYLVLDLAEGRNMPTVVFFTTRAVKTGEELLMDWGCWTQISTLLLPGQAVQSLLVCHKKERLIQQCKERKIDWRVTCQKAETTGLEAKFFDPTTLNKLDRHLPKDLMSSEDLLRKKLTLLSDILEVDIGHHRAPVRKKAKQSLYIDAPGFDYSTKASRVAVLPPGGLLSDTARQELLRCGQKLDSSPVHDLFKVEDLSCHVQIKEILDSTHPACLFGLPEEKTYGLFANRTFNKGDPVLCYGGELRDRGLVETKWDSYIYDLDLSPFGYHGPQLFISGRHSVAGKMNDSRSIGNTKEVETNVSAFLDWDNDSCTPQIVFMAAKKIETGDEILCDYGSAYWKVMWKDMMMTHANYAARTVCECEELEKELKNAPMFTLEGKEASVRALDRGHVGVDEKEASMESQETVPKELELKGVPTESKDVTIQHAPAFVSVSERVKRRQSTPEVAVSRDALVHSIGASPSTPAPASETRLTKVKVETYQSQDQWASQKINPPLLKNIHAGVIPEDMENVWPSPQPHKPVADGSRWGKDEPQPDMTGSSHTPVTGVDNLGSRMGAEPQTDTKDTFTRLTEKKKPGQRCMDIETYSGTKGSVAPVTNKHNRELTVIGPNPDTTGTYSPVNSKQNRRQRRKVAERQSITTGTDTLTIGSQKPRRRKGTRSLRRKDAAPTVASKKTPTATHAASKKPPVGTCASKLTPVATHDSKKTPTRTHASKKAPAATHSSEKRPAATHTSKKTAAATHVSEKTPVATPASKKIRAATPASKKTPVATHASKKTPTGTHASKKTLATTHASEKRPAATHTSKKTPAATGALKKTGGAACPLKKTPIATPASKKILAATPASGKTPVATHASKKTPTGTHASKKTLATTQPSEKRPAATHTSKKTPPATCALKKTPAVTHTSKQTPEKEMGEKGVSRSGKKEAPASDASKKPVAKIHRPVRPAVDTNGYLSQDKNGNDDDTQPESQQVYASNMTMSESVERANGKSSLVNTIEESSVSAGAEETVPDSLLRRKAERTKRGRAQNTESNRALIKTPAQPQKGNFARSIPTVTNDEGDGGPPSKKARIMPPTIAEREVHKGSDSETASSSRTGTQASNETEKSKASPAQDALFDKQTRELKGAEAMKAFSDQADLTNKQNKKEAMDDSKCSCPQDGESSAKKAKKDLQSQSCQEIDKSRKEGKHGSNENPEETYAGSDINKEATKGGHNIGKEAGDGIGGLELALQKSANDSDALNELLEEWKETAWTTGHDKCDSFSMAVVETKESEAQEYLQTQGYKETRQGLEHQATAKASDNGQCASTVTDDSVRNFQESPGTERMLVAVENILDGHEIPDPIDINPAISALTDDHESDGEWVLGIFDEQETTEDIEPISNDRKNRRIVEMEPQAGDEMRGLELEGIPETFDAGVNGCSAIDEMGLGGEWVSGILEGREITEANDEGNASSSDETESDDEEVMAEIVTTLDGEGDDTASLLVATAL